MVICPYEAWAIYKDKWIISLEAWNPRPKCSIDAVYTGCTPHGLCSIYYKCTAITLKYICSIFIYCLSGYTGVQMKCTIGGISGYTALCSILQYMCSIAAVCTSSVFAVCVQYTFKNKHPIRTDFLNMQITLQMHFSAEVYLQYIGCSTLAVYELQYTCSI